MSVITGEQAGFAGGHDMISHNVTAFETRNVSQFAFTAFSGVAAGHKVNSSIGGYIRGKQLDLGVCQEHCLHASRAEHALAENAIYLSDTLVFEIGVGCRHCCYDHTEKVKKDELSRLFCLRAAKPTVSCECRRTSVAIPSDSLNNGMGIVDDGA